ncbi:DUF4132 domain-containing protein [Kitasatospora viridis]|uniref:Uncharacterized protein DUF4132 n=1 Tax=Kitasatospora viridis TaxID=281105 RepID=A0A561TWQ6_9ACTN|nr:DUF4132 domain-containing protein [Kitasatospora viridis]TWF91514.1 uncharacterized protein DUF4132 [Kitasatospora viridis]
MTDGDYRGRVAALRSRWADKDRSGAATQLLGIAELCEGDWHGRAPEVVEFVRALTGSERSLIVEVLLGRLDMMGWRSRDVRETVIPLAALATRDLPTEELARWREPRLTEFEQSHTAAETEQLGTFARLEIASGRPLSPAVIATIRRSYLEGWSDPAELADLRAAHPEPAFNPGEPWADRALAHLAAATPAWRALCAHAATAVATKPSRKWLQTGSQLIDAMEPLAVRAAIVEWLELARLPRPVPLRHSYGGATDPLQWDPYNVDALRGLCWLLSLLPADADSARTLAAVVETALRKLPGVGPRSPRVANAAVYALAQVSGTDGLAQLARLSAKVTAKGTMKQIAAALEARATVLGQSREQVEELAVPSYGLTEVGSLVEQFGTDAQAELTVEGTAVRWSWRTGAGRVVKSAPQAVRSAHADRLKGLKATAKDIEKMVAAQSDRLDRQFLARRSWDLPAWREQFLDHPLVATLARRLIWTVDGTACCWLDGALRDLDGTPVSTAGPGTVEPWHPVGADPAQVLAWRDRLERHGVVQPFKQAHREVYLLTAAEEATRLYSNRFAAHVLRQHQFNALAAQRGWRNQLRLVVDAEYPPAVRELPAWGLRAEYWVGGSGHEDQSTAGSYLYLLTDQVRFYPIDAPANSTHAISNQGYRQRVARGGAVDPLPLAEVPALVLSEVLRDIDLFVGVASVGNDPTWSDGGPQGRFREYWASYGFGELSESARGRGELLARLLPRLAVGDRCRVEGRFLHVRGDLREYRIHLGSGNILMSPGDQYLCIVPRSAADPGLALPYEGDGMLAIVLSKALMLARDSEITDPTITSQLGRGTG